MKYATFLLGLALVPAAPSMAQAAMLGFQTPSGNIHCQADGHYKDYPELPEWLRCDMKVQDRIPPRPRKCDDDWGGAFALEHSGKAARICHTDTAIVEGLPILPYGATWKGMGFTCFSTPIGLTCTNRNGRGFFLSRASQRFF